MLYYSGKGLFFKIRLKKSCAALGCRCMVIKLFEVPWRSGLTQRFAKPPFVGSNPTGTSTFSYASNMARNNNIDGLEPMTQERARKWLALCKKAGLKIKVLETRRSKERQKALYAIGRTTQKDRSPVTYTLQSRHIVGEALDFGFENSQGGYTYKGNWDLAYDLAEKAGLEALWRVTGGFDRPHLQKNLKWTPHKGKKIARQELLLKAKMDQAWKYLDQANKIKKALSRLKGVKYKRYNIEEEG
jgi:hypothetical protein